MLGQEWHWSNERFYTEHMLFAIRIWSVNAGGFKGGTNSDSAHIGDANFIATPHHGYDWYFGHKRCLHGKPSQSELRLFKPFGD